MMSHDVDQSLQYNQPHAPRTPEQSRAIRKKILTVTAILSVITIVEVIIGIKTSDIHAEGGVGWEVIKWIYITLTLIKAGYIVLIFMHLGDERKNLRLTILLPMLLVVYLIWIALYEGTYILQYLQGLLP